MKRLLFIPLLALVFAAPALAGSGSATKFKPYNETLTLGAGSTVSVSFAARRGVVNVLEVWDSSGTSVCFEGVDPERWNTTPAGATTLTCTVSTAGTYLARFTSSAGNGTQVTMTP